MHKRIFCVFLQLLVLAALFTGCKTAPLPDGGKRPTVSTESVDNQSENNFGAPPVESLVYYTFEECIALATNVVEAKCLRSEFDGRNTFLIFEPLSQLKGVLADNPFRVVFPHHIYEVQTESGWLSYSYANRACPFEVGGEYLLPMIEYDKLYEPSVYYMTVSDIFIQKEMVDDEVVMYMYGSRPAEHFAESPVETITQYEQVCAYIGQLLAENPSPGRVQTPDYIRSDDPAEILDGSPYFVRVRAEAFVSDYGPYAELWRCTVTETYKGGLAAEETEVPFLPGTVEAGGEYFVLLKERLMENLPYRLSSKHSLYEADDPAADAFFRLLQNE